MRMGMGARFLLGNNKRKSQLGRLRLKGKIILK
jgi:hypothetical protein